MDFAFADFLVLVVSLFDQIGEGLVALALGFKSMPAGIGLLIGAALIFGFGSIGLVGFEVESLTVVSRLGKRDWKTMAQIVFLAGVIGAVLGIVGVYGQIVSFIEGPILAGMLTGVGIILCFVAVDAIKDSIPIGLASVISAFVIFILLKKDENAFIYAFCGSMIISVIVARFVPFSPIVPANVKEKIALIPLDRFRFLKNPLVIRGALALLALRCGTSIAYSGITSQVANLPVDVDHTNIIAGVAGASSAAFGGAPIEPLISMTGLGPNPYVSAPLIVAVVGILMLLGVLPRLARHIPMSAVAGILFLLGAAIAIPENMGYVMTENDTLTGPVTLVVTVATMDPFLGLLAGIAIRALANIDLF